MLMVRDIMWVGRGEGVSEWIGRMGEEELTVTTDATVVNIAVYGRKRYCR
jgi:hypothetical protein